MPEFPVVIDAVAKVGFPIVAALGLTYVIREIAQWGMKTGDRLAARFETHVDVLDKSQAEIGPKLDELKGLAGCRFSPPAGSH